MAPRPPRRVTTSPAGGGSKASSHQLVGKGAGGSRVRPPTLATGCEEAQSKRNPDARHPTPLPTAPQSPALTSRPGLRCSSQPRGETRARDHAPGAAGKSFFSCSPAAHRARLLLSPPPRARSACAPPPPWGGGEEGQGVCVRGRMARRGGRHRSPRSDSDSDAAVARSAERTEEGAERQDPSTLCSPSAARAPAPPRAPPSPPAARADTYANAKVKGGRPSPEGGGRLKGARRGAEDGAVTRGPGILQLRLP